jgi:hypothetical protein
MQRVKIDLEKRGHIITSKWLNTDGVPRSDKKSYYARYSINDLRDLCDAQILIAFTEPPPTPSGGGRHVELGVAIGRGMRAIVIGPRENIFCHLPTIEWYPDYLTFLASANLKVTK